MPIAYGSSIGPQTASQLVGRAQTSASVFKHLGNRVTLAPNPATNRRLAAADTRARRQSERGGPLR
jgi:hypothetical protein